MKLKKLLSMILVVALVVITASFTPSAVVEAKAKKKYVKSIKVARTVTVTKGKSKTVKIKVKVKGKASKKFTAKIKNNGIASAKKRGNKLIIKGKKAGSTKIIIKSKGKGKKGKKLKKTINIYVVASEKKSNGGNSKPILPQTKTVLSELTIDNPDIEINKETKVIFKGTITNGEEESYPVVNKSGDIMGYIYDDGYNVDEQYDDGVYSGEITLYSRYKHEENYYVWMNEKKSEAYATVYYYKPITDADNEEYDAFVVGIDYIAAKYDKQTE